MCECAKVKIKFSKLYNIVQYSCDNASLTNLCDYTTRLRLVQIYALIPLNRKHLLKNNYVLL
jgi:hypothetical protein